MDTKVTAATDPEVFFFGCKAPPHAAGHSLYSKHTSTYRLRTPWGDSLDGGLLHPKGADGKPDYNSRADTTPVNRVVLAVKDGWTAVSFWDRSGDSRGASNSAFVVHDEWPVARDETVVDRVLRLARDQWPEIFARPGFPLPATNGRRIHVLPIDDGHFTGTDAILHCAQLTCWCHPMPDTEAPLTIVHNAKDCRETADRRRERLAALGDEIQNEPEHPGWMLVGEDF